MIERNGGDPGIVERVGEAVVATRVLGCTVRDKNNRSGMVDRHRRVNTRTPLASTIVRSSNGTPFGLRSRPC
jgi:hypothetical protein